MILTAQLFWIVKEPSTQWFELFQLLGIEIGPESEPVQPDRGHH